MGFRIGIDVGGTFTDFLVTGPCGRTAVHKELSTPADPSVAVMTGLGALGAGMAMPLARFLGAVDLIVHGTTVTTNAVLTGNTAHTGLLTTRGFRDALQMRRGIREEMYDNRYHPPAPLVPRHLRLPVSERTVAERLPGAYVSVSSQVLPQIRFYERTSTTVLNAAVGPILAGYIGNLTASLAGAGFGGKLLVMQSNGGVATAGADGYDHIGLINCAGGILAQDYEMFEIHDPHFLVKHEYLPESAGAGRWRGGLGVETEFVMRGENVTGVAFGDGVEEEARAFGFFGGGAGSRNSITLTYPDGTRRAAKSKEIIRGIPPGTVFNQKAGGGGYGNPFERPAAQVIAEVKDGLLSAEAALAEYGVAIDPATLTLDAKRTAQLRKR